jgi:hypothetical protein
MMRDIERPGHDSPLVQLGKRACLCLPVTPGQEARERRILLVQPQLQHLWPESVPHLEPGNVVGGRVLGKGRDLKDVAKDSLCPGHVPPVVDYRKARCPEVIDVHDSCKISVADGLDTTIINTC